MKYNVFANVTKQRQNGGKSLNHCFALPFHFTSGLYIVTVFTSLNPDIPLKSQLK